MLIARKHHVGWVALLLAYVFLRSEEVGSDRRGVCWHQTLLHEVQEAGWAAGDKCILKESYI